MRSDHCDTCTPHGELVVRVHYCYDHQSWRGQVDVLVTTVGGQTIDMGTVRKEFGPFDSSTEVGYWLAAQARALKAIAHPDMMEKLCGEDGLPPHR